MLVNPENETIFLDFIKKDPVSLKTINLLMRDGKRSKAEKVLFRALDHIDKDYPGQANRIFYLAILSVKQDIAVRVKPKPRKRRNKKSFDVYLPRLVSPSVGLNLGIRSLIHASRKRSESSLIPFWEGLYVEILNAAQNKGEVVYKRYSTNKLAVSNKRRVHFMTVNSN